MQSHLKGLFLLFALVLISSCAHKPVADQTIHVTLLHLNDVYEITPVSGGKFGGLARVATLRQQLLKRNPNTITLIGGDFFSPSAMGTAKLNGERLAGGQMVSVLNTMGLQYATFGNHEFDIKQAEFEKRMQESKFNWISSNVFDQHGKPINSVKDNTVLHFKNADGNSDFRIGLFGLTIDSNKAEYVSYKDPLEIADQQLKKLQKQSDFIIALTHLSLAQDETLVKSFPTIDLVLGGHEHENYQRWRGNQTPILKADANARSVYVVDLYFDPDTETTRIVPSLQFIDDKIADDEKVKSVVDEWVSKVFNAFRQQGFDPEEIVATVDEDLDGLEASVRNQTTNLSRLIAQAMLAAYDKADLSIYNAGSIRIDDILPAGEISVYDIIRTLPFGGQVALVELDGNLLLRVLDQGLKNRGSGGFLQSANTELRNGEWFVKQKKINPAQSYIVAIADFLMSGKETGLAFLADSHSEIKRLDSGNNSDIRQLLINYMKKITNQHE